MRGNRFPKTVLILGAGASHHLNYPVGGQLLATIQSLSSQGQHAEHRRFHQQLNLACPPSIDNFLKSHENDADYQHHAKGLILFAIFAAESNASVDGGQGNDWYTFLADTVENHMRNGTGSFEDVSVISFNYDRSFEHTLATRMLNRNHAKNMKSALKLIGGDRVVHIYGRLPHTPDEYFCAKDVDLRPLNVFLPEYGMSSQLGPNDSARIETCMSFGKGLIKTFFENSVESEKASQLIREAEHVVFLGFAYHPQNMQALGFDFADKDACHGKTIVGTSYRMSPTQVALVQNDSNDNIKLFPVTCLGLFQNHFALGTQFPVLGEPQTFPRQR